MSKQAPTSQARPDAPGAKKIGLAVVLGLVMVVVSTTTAIYTGYLLWRGDPGTEVLNSLPAGCEVLLLTQDLQGLDKLSGDPKVFTQLPTALAAPLTVTQSTFAEPIRRLSAVYRPGSGVGMCRWKSSKGPVWLLTLGVPEAADDALETVQTLLAAQVGRAGERWTSTQAVGGFIEHLLEDTAGRGSASILQGPERLLMAWSPAPGASAALVEVIEKANTAPLREDNVMRAALERVGGGELQVAWRAEALGAWLAAPLKGTPLDGMMETIPPYLGLSLRLDADAELLHLHSHMGAQQRGVALLKRRFDPSGALPASDLLRWDMEAGGVLRASPQSLAKETALWASAPVWGDFARALAGASNDPMTALAEVAPHLTGHVLWGRPPGESKLVFRAQLTEAGEAALAQRPGVQVNEGWLMVGVWPAPSRSSTLSEAAAKERSRMLDQHQGYWLSPAKELPDLGRGPFHLETLWLDTGVVLHLSTPRESRQ